MSIRFLTTLLAALVLSGSLVVADGDLDSQRIASNGICGSLMICGGGRLDDSILDRFMELARFHAIEGKTWNHPVVIGDRLYIRNAQEAACYRLPMVTDAVETPEEIPST